MESALTFAVTRGIAGYEWGYLIALVWIYLGCVLALALLGHAKFTGNPLLFFFQQISESLTRLTGFPGAAMAGALTGLMSLLIAVIGFYWDVAWHIDLGRDKNLFTPAHVMILVGLGGISFAGAVSAVMSLIDGRRIPRAASVLAVLGIGSASAFPLDNLWHKTYGLDLTLWSPSHLMLIGGGTFGTLAVLLLLAEVLPEARPTAVGRFVIVMATGAALLGMSVFQGEFDYGVPQFQLVYLPILVMAAGGFTLVFSRLALGPGGALKAVGFYLLLRVVIGFLVAGTLGHTYPHFPLYLASAGAVEVAALFVGTTSRLRFGLVAGALVGTVGLAGELAWIAVSGYGSATSSSLLGRIALLAPPAALAAAVLGAGLGRAFAPGKGRVPAVGLALAAVVLFATLAVPLRRDVGHVQALITLDHHAAGQARVAVKLTPPDAAAHADAFNVTSWQGGGRVRAELKRVGPGSYVTTRAVPITGTWKTIVALDRGTQVMAAPVYLPADKSIGAKAFPALDSRQTPFVRNTKLLLRETKKGPPLPATLAYTAWGVSIALWMGLLAFVALRIGASDRRRGGHATAVARPSWSARLSGSA